MEQRQVGFCLWLKVLTVHCVSERQKGGKIIALSRSFVPLKLVTTSLACIRNKRELRNDDVKGKREYQQSIIPDWWNAENYSCCSCGTRLSAFFAVLPKNRNIKSNVEVLSDANANLDFLVLRRSQSRPCQLCSQMRRWHWRGFVTILHSSRTTYKSAMFCSRDIFPGFERLLRFETLIGERNKKWHKTLFCKETLVLRWWGRMIHENFGFI